MRKMRLHTQFWLGNLRFRWEDAIKIDVKEVGCESGMNLFGSG
jgi:hypothetical protein